jgi:PDZ domain-containing protein
MTEETISTPTPGIGSMPAEPPPPPRRRRRRWPWATFIAVAVIIAVASRINLNYYAVQPGTATPVQQFITVPADKGHPVKHSVLLTDVQIAQVSSLSYLYYKLQANTDLFPLEAITGGAPPSEFTAQGNLEMSQAESSAKAAALTRLGYPVSSQPAGAVVAATYPKTPAFAALNVGDVISAVNGTSTPNAQGLVTVLHNYHSGQQITLSVTSSGSTSPKPVPITLKNTLIDVGGGVMQTEDLGIQVGDQVNYTFPFPLTINVANIGGPSAGLAMTLGVIDELTGGSLTGGKTVAATGTIDAQGNVGDVGGVPQKTIAVENAGATIFLVPPQEFKAAKSKQGKGLQIYSVSTLDQALQVLAAHGGVVPPAPTPSTPTSAPPGG